ncbi:oxidoreductase-like protein [Phyllosticta citribraziliensis]|uniref:Oxidoreductase-like protein n=1 Tax=Phyllosticta citribraziliensis TaxID=989973 RepID=A0ABR1LTV5_9PEZI
MALRRAHVRLCANCLQHIRLSHHTLPTASASPVAIQCRKKSKKSVIAPPGQQAWPLRGYYAEILSHPIHSNAAASRQSKAETKRTEEQDQNSSSKTSSGPVPSTAPSSPSPSTGSSDPSAGATIPEPAPQPNASTTSAREETQAKAQIVFGSRLAGPTERKAARKAAAREVAGVEIPPRPEEPDNCCMSGCVNCVWDVYRDELEEWALASREAKRRMKEMKAAGEKDPEKERQVAAAEKERRRLADAAASSTSMDDDGGGSEALWSAEELGGDEAPAAVTEDDLFKDIPVGIREFMKTEKKLKQMHAAEEASSPPPP